MSHCESTRLRQTWGIRRDSSHLDLARCKGIRREFSEVVRDKRRRDEDSSRWLTHGSHQSEVSRSIVPSSARSRRLRADVYSASLLLGSSGIFCGAFGAGALWMRWSVLSVLISEGFLFGVVAPGLDSIKLMSTQEGCEVCLFSARFVKLFACRARFARAMNIV